ncbi:MAG: diguanylate cyclase [Pseudomonadota bacterium]
MLIQVAKRLRNLMRQEDTIGRLGGDEFAIVLFELARDRDKAREQAGLVAKKIHAELDKTYELDNHAFKVTPTIGVTLFSEDGGRKSRDTIPIRCFWLTIYIKLMFQSIVSPIYLLLTVLFLIFRQSSVLL